MTGIDAVQAVMEEFAPDTPKRRTLQERRAMLAKGKRYMRRWERLFAHA